MPARILHDYDPDSDQAEADWLASQWDTGWKPEYGYGVPVHIDGKLLHRWAMIREEVSAVEPDPLPWQ
jgi:hypothetical protein